MSCANSEREAANQLPIIEKVLVSAGIVVHHASAIVHQVLSSRSSCSDYTTAGNRKFLHTGGISIAEFLSPGAFPDRHLFLASILAIEKSSQLFVFPLAWSNNGQVASVL